MDTTFYNSGGVLPPTVNMAALENGSMMYGSESNDVYFDDAFDSAAMTLHPNQLDGWDSSSTQFLNNNQSSHLFSNEDIDATLVDIFDGFTDLTTADKPMAIPEGGSTGISPPIHAESTDRHGSTGNSEPVNSEKLSTPVKKTRASRKRRKKEPTVQEVEAKRAKFLERNRVAASKCRSKKKDWTETMESKLKGYEHDRVAISVLKKSLEEELEVLRELVFKHAACNHADIDEYLTNQPIREAADQAMLLSSSGINSQDINFDWMAFSAAQHEAIQNEASPGPSLASGAAIDEAASRRNSTQSTVQPIFQYARSQSNSHVHSPDPECDVGAPNMSRQNSTQTPQNYTTQYTTTASHHPFEATAIPAPIKMEPTPLGTYYGTGQNYALQDMSDAYIGQPYAETVPLSYPRSVEASRIHTRKSIESDFYANSDSGVSIMESPVASGKDIRMMRSNSEISLGSDSIAKCDSGVSNMGTPDDKVPITPPTGLVV